MGNIFTDAIRRLVKPTAEADEVSAVGQPLQIDKGNACRRQIPRARDSPLSHQLEDAVAIGDGRFDRTAMHCHVVLSRVMSWNRVLFIEGKNILLPTKNNILIA
ncbi:hypothetical protein ACNPPY_13475 [Achromobacter sp. AGC78]